MKLKDLLDVLSNDNHATVTFENDIYHIFAVWKKNGTIECTFERELSNLDKEVNYFTVMKDKSLLIEIKD